MAEDPTVDVPADEADDAELGAEQLDDVAGGRPLIVAPGDTP